MKNLDNIHKELLLDNLDQFVIEPYEDKWQNQVMTLGLRILSDEVDEANREFELKILTICYKENLYKAFIENMDNTLFVLRNCDKIYGFIGVRTSKGIANLNGFYLEQLLRGTGFAIKMLTDIETFCKYKHCSELHLDTAFYSKRSISFYEKHGFVRYKTETINSGKLEIYYYSKKL